MVNVGGSHFKATLKMLYLYGYKGFVPVVAEEVGYYDKFINSPYFIVLLGSVVDT